MVSLLLPQQVVCSRHLPQCYVLVCLTPLILTLLCEHSAHSLSVPRWSSVCSSHTLGWKAASPPPHPQPALPKECVSSHHSTPVLWFVSHLGIQCMFRMKGTRESITNSVDVQLSGGGRGGLWVWEQIWHRCYRNQENVTASSVWREWLRAFCPPTIGKWQKKHFTCSCSLRCFAARPGTEILTIGVICGPFFTSCQTEL